MIDTLFYHDLDYSSPLFMAANKVTGMMHNQGMLGEQTLKPQWQSNPSASKRFS